MAKAKHAFWRSVALVLTICAVLLFVIESDHTHDVSVTPDLRIVLATEVPYSCVELLRQSTGVDLGGRRLSQGLQDPVLRATFSCIGATNRYYVEFGFNEPGYGMGGTGPNTFGLWTDGWRGLLLDGGQENATINLHRHFLFYSNIGAIFRRYNVPVSPDYLSVDMDSHDWFVALGIFEAGYRPRVITFEFNLNYVTESLINLPIAVLDPTFETKANPPAGYEFKFRNCSWGASPAAIEILARKYGYTRIRVISDLDVLYLRDDLVPPSIVREAATRSALWDSYAPLSHSGLAHPRQQDQSNLDHLVDVDVLLRKGDIRLAQGAAYGEIRSIASASKCWKDAGLIRD